MKWYCLKNGYVPIMSGRVLTYSEIYKDKPELAYRIMDGQFVSMCNEVTHYAYLSPPKD